MSFLRNLVERINSNVIARNVVLAVCGIIVFVFTASILLNIFTRHNNTKIVPDFAGMNIEEAVKVARHASLKVEINDSLFVPTYDGGLVLDQSPVAGAKVKSGRRIFVTINSYRQKMVQIPYVTGYSLRQAKNNLEIAGLGIDKLIYRSDLATNNVLEQRYQGKPILHGSKMEAEIGSDITLVVGMGSEGTTQAVPKTVGFPLHEAKSRLWEVGLNVGKVEFDEGISLLNQNDAKVYIQVPEQGHRVELGTSVSIKLTLDQDKTEKGSSNSDKQAKTIISAQKDEAQTTATE